MNDNGNFQLRDKDSFAIWDSFSYPTDTLLPDQEIELNGSLSSRQGAFNFSRGRCKLHLQEDGNLVLNLINLPSNYSYDPYYSSDTNSDDKNQSNVGQRLIFDKSSFLYIERKGGDNFSISSPNEAFSTNDFYYKATMNYDGVFGIATYPKDQTRGQSWVIQKTIPENICLFSSFRDEGVCGFNSVCTLANDQRPNCTCPDEYSLIDSNNKYAGCIRNFQVICQAGGNWGSKDDIYTMKELPNIDWPQSDYEKISPSSLQECKESCLHDCLCVLAHFDQSTCWKKKLPVSYGRNDQTVKGIAIMKLMKNDHLSSLSNEKKDHNTLIIVILVLLGSSVFVILTLLGIMFLRFHYNHKKIKSSRNNQSNFVNNNLRSFSFKEIIEATSNFREELGRGSCSIVYKGTIEMIINLAVKKLDKLIQDSDKEFQTEMSVIGQTHHINLVRLIGYCNEGQHRILVYELMSNGTLANFLFAPLKPNWKERVNIALGIARGLVYLHEGCCTQIIHCDIKPQNILLDDQYNARISDFGLAKVLLINQSHTETGIRGTKGYVAPDWFRSSPINAKVDTYSFGVLLLEIICCRKNVEKEFFTEEKGILTDWAYDCYKNKRLDILLESDNEVGSVMMSLEKLVMIVIWCIQEDPSFRPTMKEVLLMLEGNVEVVVPPSPYLYGSVTL